MTNKVGERPGRGRYECINCGQSVILRNNDETLPPCVGCKGGEFLAKFLWKN